MIKADKLRFEELLDNIINNSIKFTPENGQISVYAECSDKKVRFSVADTGRGMTFEQYEKIFVEFYKADQSRHEINSSGLGLSICKRIVEKHGGEIWVESPGLGKGSVFYFTFDLA
jgi:signal transduction histidine kinase